MDDTLLAEHVDGLYAVAREDFVDERDRRVRELKQDGHKQEAAALGRSRKPTVAAWVVDQLARREAARVDELLEAGGALRAVQHRAASGRDADGLRAATRRVRDLVGDLTAAARAVLDDAGAAEGHADEVGQTLFAAATDPDLHETLRRGTFTRAVTAAGFGTVAGLASVDAPSTPPRSADEGEDAATEELAARRRREEERAVRQARRAALERQRADLQRSRVRQQRRVDRAREREADLRARADQAAVEAQAREDDRDAIDAELEQLDAELQALPDD